MNKFESFLAQQLEQYVTYRHNLGYAMKASLSHLKTFDRYLKQKQAQQVLLQPSFFMGLQADLKIEPRSVNRIISSVRVFFNYLVRNGLYKQNPLKDIPYLPENDIMPYIFSPQQVNHLLSAVSNQIRKGSQRIYLKDLSGYMAMVLLARCGLRISEPLRLKLNDYRFDEKTIYIKKTKFKKDRLIPLPQSVAIELENYLAVRRCLLADVDNKYLLANSTERGLNDNRVRTVFHRAVSDIGLEKPRQIIGNVNISSPTPHSLRHYAEFRIMPSKIPQSGGSLALWLILLGIIRDF
ncbi:MAG: tyrosine-type recombinase/integrase [Desulfobacterales bacterium]